MSEFTEKRAQKLLERGLHAADKGDFITALHEFKASAFVRRSTDALTHWGWMEHQLGDTARAIELCHEAIAVDPESGNPYNDIGTYLVAMGRADDAISWFKRAITAKRYLPRQFPHINLGKVYLARKQYKQALHHFEEALRLNPEDEEIVDIIHSIRRSLQ